MSDATVTHVPAGQPDTCVVVRMYNESKAVGPVIADLREHFRQVVCVDDGSSDNSAAVAQAEGAIVVRHATNLGGGAALQTGLEYAVRYTDAHFILTFDADGQHRVVDALALLDAARHGKYDVVTGSRFLGVTSNIPASRRLLLRVAVAMTRVTTGLRLTDTHNGLRVLSRSVAESMKLTHNGMAYASELQNSIARFGWRYAEVPVSVLYTDYSRDKGQRSLNAINIVFDLMMARVRFAR